MVDFVELNRQRQIDKQFRETEIGKALYDFENALIHYWQNDANERISDKRLRELDDKARSTRKVLYDLLLEGVTTKHG